MERMKQIPDGSVDAVINDPPFGVTANEWDQVLPLDAMWAEYDRILKPNGVVVLFACGGQSDEPFLGKLIMSNPKMFRYSDSTISGFFKVGGASLGGSGHRGCLQQVLPR